MVMMMNMMRITRCGMKGKEHGWDFWSKFRPGPTLECVMFDKLTSEKWLAWISGGYKNNS
jgi:hypothetical protein